MTSVSGGLIAASLAEWHRSMKLRQTLLCAVNIACTPHASISAGWRSANRFYFAGTAAASSFAPGKLTPRSIVASVAANSLATTLLRIATGLRS